MQIKTTLSSYWIVAILFFSLLQLSAQAQQGVTQPKQPALPRLLRNTNAVSSANWPVRSIKDTVLPDIDLSVTPPADAATFPGPDSAPADASSSPATALSSTAAARDTLRSFCLGRNAGQINVWGRGAESPGVYLYEYLPAIFSRSIDLSRFAPADGYLEWIFTGDHGGFTLRLDEDSLVLTQRYYDSYGFNDVIADSDRIMAGRHPEKDFSVTRTSFRGTLKRVAVTCTHDLLLRVYLNDILVYEGPSLIDVSRHQLRYTGKEGELCGAVLEPATVKTKVTVDQGRSFQSILGFGGSASIPAYHMLDSTGKKEWWKWVKDYNLLIQREYPIGSRLRPDYSNWDDGRDANPHYYGDNFPNGEISDFNYLKKIRELNGLVIFEFWVLPSWCYGPGKDSIRYDKYAEAMLNYCKTSVQKTGRAPDILGIENEITLSAEKWRQMTFHLRKILDDNGFRQVKLHMHNAPNLAMGVKAVEAFRSDPQEWSDIDYAATNIYDYQYTIFNPDGYDKTMAAFHKAAGDRPFISTEICVNVPQLQAGSYKLAFSYGQLYHKNLVELDAVSLMYCWTLLTTEQPSYSASRSLFGVDRKDGVRPVPSSYQLRVFGSFSRHLLRNMHRVATTSDNSSLFTSAYTDGRHRTVILLNRGVTPQKISLRWPGIKLPTVEITSAYSANRPQPFTGELTLEGGEIATIYQ